jgi:ribosomal RNA methyltransferase Nop2
MAKSKKNKQPDPPSLDDVGAGKKRKQDNGVGANKRKRPKSIENTNLSKIKGQRVNGKLVVPEKTRVAGKLVKPVAKKAKAAESDDDDFASFGSDENDESSSDVEQNGVPEAEKAALFDSDSELEADNDDPLVGQDSEDDVMLTDEENEPARGMFSDSDDEELLTAANMEAMSRKIDEEEAEDKELAEQELLEPGMEAPQILPSAGEGLDDSQDLKVVSSRLQEIVRVLSDFKSLGEAGKSRKDYVDQFQRDVMTYFGYSEYLAERFISFFSPAEALAFFEANETPRPIVIRVNTLKTTKRDLSKALIDRGVNLGEVGKWTKCALQIHESTVPIGATPEYMAGHYILQAASSLVPVLALKPVSGDKVLDMAAAPGGKTSFLAQEMKNGGVIIANEVSKRRQKSLVGNVVRMGCRNVVSVGFDGRDFGAGKTGVSAFDKVLLDAPCSGTGVIHKDPSVKTNRTEKDFQVVSQLQRQLLLSAIDSLKVGGVVVYSTCSVMIDENEMVVDYALRNRNVKLEKIEVNVGEEGLTSFKEKRFHPTLNLTKRFYPHVHNMDGFFVSRLRKLGNEKAATPATVKNLAKAEQEIDQTVIDQVEEDDEGITVFDNSEDDKIIAEGRRHQLRKKGKRLGSKPVEEDESNDDPAKQRKAKPDPAPAPSKLLRKPGFKKDRPKPTIIDYGKPQKS